MTDDRIDWHLWNWAVWMGRGTGMPRSRCPASASGGMGISHGSDFETMVDTADATCATAVDAILDGMQPAVRATLYHVWLESVYRFPRGNFEALHAAARDIVGRGLDRRGVI